MKGVWGSPSPHLRLGLRYSGLYLTQGVKWRSHYKYLVKRGCAMKKYFVIDIQKVKSADEFNKIVLGHNLRRRRTSRNKNIDFSKSSKNIVLSDFTEKSISTYLEKKNGEARASGGRALRKNSAFAFNVVVDCSPDESWTEQDYIRYLKDAYAFFKERFSNNDILAASIHMDETKPHLHLTISYFDNVEKKWSQKKMAQKKLTDFNLILSDFQKSVGEKYNLHRGDGVKKKQLIKLLKKNDAVERIEVKQGLLSKKEKTLLNPSKTLKTFEKLKETKLLADNIQLKNEVVKLRSELDEKERSLRELTMRLRAEQEKRKREIKKMREQASQELAAEKEKIFNYAAEKIREEKSRADRLAAELATEKRKNAELKEKMAELFIKYNIKPGISEVSSVGD
jgi:hypothetical protein